MSPAARPAWRALAAPAAARRLHRHQPGVAPQLHLRRPLAADHLQRLAEQAERRLVFTAVQRTPGAQHHAGLPAEALANALDGAAGAGCGGSISCQRAWPLK